MATKTIGLVPHPTKNVQQSITVLAQWRDSHGARLVALASDVARVGPGIDLLTADQFVGQVDFVVALGGDGTMLGAMRLVASRPVPVLGVNYGNLGFLVEVEPNELPAALEKLTGQDFSLEAHHALEVTVTTPAPAGGAGASESTHLAFNDVSFARQPGRGTVSADLTVGGILYGYYKADAIIVSTPAGSTAYNYAAGGPVLSPAVTATIITPVAPMSGINRSVVLGPLEVLEFAMRGETSSAAIEVDGRVVGSTAEGSLLQIRLLVDAGSVVRLDAARHSGKGRLKLSLLDLPLRSDQLLELVPQEVRRQFREFAAKDRAARP